MQVLDKVPSMAVLQTYVKEGKLKKELDSIHPLTYLFLRWIMNCNEAHIYAKNYEETLTVNSQVGPAQEKPTVSVPMTDEQMYANSINQLQQTSVNKFQLFGIHCTPPRKVPGCHIESNLN